MLSGSLATPSTSTTAFFPRLLAVLGGSALLPTRLCSLPDPPAHASQLALNHSSGKIKASSYHYFLLLFPACPALILLQSNSLLARNPRSCPIQLVVRAWHRGPSQPPTPTSAQHGAGRRFSRPPGSSPLHPCLIAYFWAIMLDRENLFLSRADPRTASNP